MAFEDDELSRFLMMMGLGMMGARSLPEGVSRGGMFGLQGVDQMRKSKDERRLLEAKLREEELQAKVREATLERQKKLMEVFGGAGAQPQPAGSQRSVVDAPGWTPQVPAAPQQDVAQMLLKAGFIKEAEDYAKARGAIHGEAYGNLQTAANGRPYYMTKQGPRYAENGAPVPQEELHFGDTGDRSNVGFNKFTGAQVSPGVVKGMSPAEKDAAGRFWATFNRGELREVPQADGSLGLGFVTPKGVQMVPGVGRKQERLHDGAAEKLLQIDQMMHSAGVALDEMEKNPGHGPGPVIGRLPDFMANYLDPKGLRSRQFLSDVTTQITLARSGAAVTESEYKRLEPFLASPKDTEAVAKSKLDNLMKEYAAIRAARSQFYREQGYRVPEPSMGALPSNMARGQIGRMPSVAEIEAELMRRQKR